jgi:hypothetical protein
VDHISSGDHSFRPIHFLFDNGRRFKLVEKTATILNPLRPATRQPRNKKDYEIDVTELPNRAEPPGCHTPPAIHEHE